MKNIGTVVRGIRTPIIMVNDNLPEIVVDSLLAASKEAKFDFDDRDIVGITESIVGRSEGNFASLNDIAEDIKSKFKSGHVGVIFPIMSRNRFALILQGIARGAKKLTVMLKYPEDEVGNHLFKEELLEKYDINPYSDLLTEEEYNKHFKKCTHEFTGINYVALYREIIEKENCEAEIIFSNNPIDILKYTKEVLCCDIHTRNKTKAALKKKAKVVYSLDNILNKSINGSGYNKEYGLLGSNRSTDDTLKLFPRTGNEVVKKVHDLLLEKTGKNIEVMVYGDGAFKDPVGKIWELADPVVSPAYTDGLIGTPNELKLKYLSDNKYSNLRGEELKKAIIKEIKNKDKDLKGTNASLGTTPRRLTDLIGSLCDLTSGSGDKGTPVIYIKGYFDNYSSGN
jgi:hypothetical protein